MEVTIEKLKTINGKDSKPKKTPSVSDLKLDALSIAAPEVPVAADVAEDENQYFSDYDGYFSDEEKKKSVAPLKPEVTEEEESGKTVDMLDKDYSVQAYTVHVDGHRILTVSTYSNAIASRWIREVLGCFRKKKGRGGDQIVVGVCVDREFLRYEKGGLKDRPYDIIQLCVGSQCLIYELPETYDVRYDKCPLRGFFSDCRVITTGVNMTAIAKKLFKDHGFEFSKVVDLNEMAVKVFEDFQDEDNYLLLIDLKKYGLDTLGTLVLGQNWYIERPKTKVEWFPNGYWQCRGLGMEKAKYFTYDAYLNYMIGARLLEINKVKKSAASAGKKRNKKKGKNN